MCSWPVLKKHASINCAAPTIEPYSASVRPVSGAASQFHARQCKRSNRWSPPALFTFPHHYHIGGSTANRKNNRQLFSFIWEGLGKCRQVLGMDSLAIGCLSNRWPISLEGQVKMAMKIGLMMRREGWCLRSAKLPSRSRKECSLLLPPQQQKMAICLGIKKNFVSFTCNMKCLMWLLTYHSKSAVTKLFVIISPIVLQYTSPLNIQQSKRIMKTIQWNFGNGDFILTI